MNTRQLSIVSLSVAAAFALGFNASARADQISLLANGTTSFSANSAGTVFSLQDIQPAGSGVFNPFVRIQGSNGENGNEQGYNTKNTGATLDDTSNGPANPVITMNSVVDQNSTINLALDYNEPGSSNKSTIVLENLTLVVSTNGNKSGPAAPGTFSPQSIPSDPGDVTLYNMASTTRTDAGFVGNSFDILMDADNNLANGNGGSGQSDLLVQINVAGIDPSLLDSNHFLYVYSQFSDAEGGFEEWALQAPTTPLGGSGVPEPASLGVLGLGILGLALRRRARA